MRNKKTICILGATGSIGIELTASLLRNSENVLAVVRDEKKLQKMLELRGLASTESRLTTIESDLFSENVIQNSKLEDAIKKSDYVFNCASPKISWMPFSKINRKWGEPVASLTKNIVNLGKGSESFPHVLVFCGPEYFKEYDGTNGFLGGFLSLILKSLIGALRDNYIEISFLLNSDYKKWTVFRCGSIQGWTGVKGDASKVGIDHHKNKSDHSKGKGKSLVVEDLSAFLADLISSGKISSLNKKMPFVFNTKF